MFRETEQNTLQAGFIKRNEIVGWTQNNGVSRPVTGVVIGREMSGVVSGPKGIKIRVQNYVQPTGNEYLLNSLPNSAAHEGISGKEYVISQDFSPEYAMALEYSPVILNEGKFHIVDLGQNFSSTEVAPLRIAA